MSEINQGLWQSMSQRLYLEVNRHKQNVIFPCVIVFHREGVNLIFEGKPRSVKMTLKDN